MATEFELQPSPRMRTSKSVFPIGAKTDWTPILTCASPGNLSVSYFDQEGRAYRFGDFIYLYFIIRTSSFTHTTASGALLVTGVPYDCIDDSQVQFVGAMTFNGITKANRTQFTPQISNALERTVNFQAAGSGQSVQDVEIVDLPTGGTVILICSLWYLAREIS